jgi:chromosome segregation ATPase
MSPEQTPTAKELAEIEKLKAEAESLRRPPSFIWTNWIPLLGGLAALSTAVAGTVIQWKVTDIQSERQKLAAERSILDADSKVLAAKKEVISSQEEISKLRAERQEQELAKKRAAEEVVKSQEEISKLTADGQELELARKSAIDEMNVARERVSVAKSELERIQTELEAALTKATDSNTREAISDIASNAKAASSSLSRQNQLIYLQFRGAISRDTMRGLQSQLRDAGYLVPGIERIAGSYLNEVRYFKKDDVEVARKVASIAAKFFQEKKCSLPSRITEKFVSQDKPPDQIELWVFLSCPD